MRRRREKVVRNSMSCTDEEWQRIREIAKATGETIGRLVVRRGSTDDPPPDTGPRGTQALDPDAQRAMHDAILRLAGTSETGPGDSSWRMLVPGCARFLCASRIRTMLREGREEALDEQLRQAFGEETGPKVLAALTGTGDPGDR